MLGRAGEDISGRSIGEFHANPAFATAALERLARKETLRDHHGRLRHKNGMIRHVLIDANGLWEQGRLVHSRWFVRDISIRVELQTELLQIVERERQRIGHDLHDGLGQHLHGISYLAALLEKGLQEEASPRAREAGRLNKHLNHALELTRSLAHGFQPINPVPEGLMLALRELAQRIGGLYRADCRFECRVPVLIHRHSASTHLYRIAQEAVSNAIKHGKATRIQIQLATTPQQIVLGVRDNGVGIRHRAKRSKGMGLHIMQYRADAIGGSMVVRKLPRRGTEVVCTVPRQALLLHDKGIK
jgi:signal transduction histidine kinase